MGSNIITDRVIGMSGVVCVAHLTFLMPASTRINRRPATQARILVWPRSAQHLFDVRAAQAALKPNVIRVARVSRSRMPLGVRDLFHFS
jgi:hypothetical protein